MQFVLLMGAPMRSPWGEAGERRWDLEARRGWGSRLCLNLTLRRGDMAADTPRYAVESTYAATGIAGLDTVLGGGVARRRLYVIEGPPGAGKTTLALHFLLAGRD